MDQLQVTWVGGPWLLGDSCWLSDKTAGPEAQPYRSNDNPVGLASRPTAINEHGFTDEKCQGD